MNEHRVRGVVERFPGKNGWFYVRLGDPLDAMLREEVRSVWPALMKVECTLGETTWQGTIMPIKEGPLFTALPAKIRKAEGITVGQRVTIDLRW